MELKMASNCVLNVLKKVQVFGIINKRCFHKTETVFKVQAGKYKTTRNKTNPLTYEKLFPPPRIAHAKTWNSWNTTTLKDGIRVSETLLEDIFIRKFIDGTFPRMLASEVIIKRQHNIIRIAMILVAKLSKSKFMFLIGYTEEMLSYWFQCPVKLEIYFVGNFEDTIVKYV